MVTAAAFFQGIADPAHHHGGPLTEMCGVAMSQIHRRRYGKAVETVRQC